MATLISRLALLGLSKLVPPPCPSCDGWAIARARTDLRPLSVICAEVREDRTCPSR